MSELNLSIRTKGFKEALAALGAVADNLPQEVYISLDKAGRKVQREVVDIIYRELNTTKKVIKKQTRVVKNRTLLTARVLIYESARIPLRDFKAKQNKKGVTAKISRRKPKKLYRPGFIIQKFGKHAFTRPNNGRKISKLKGASPWGVLIKNPDKINEIVFASDQLIRAELLERVRYLNMKKEKKLNWQQKK